MVEMYFALVINKRRTCDENNLTVPLVPARHRAEVLILLNERGYNADGTRIG